MAIPPGDDFTIYDPHLRFMYDYWINTPVWGDGDNLDDGWLRRALGIDDELVADLAHWVRAMDSMDATIESDGRLLRVVTGADEYEQRWELNAQALRLVDRLVERLTPIYSVQYVPWSTFPGQPVPHGTPSVFDDNDYPTE